MLQLQSRYLLSSLQYKLVNIARSAHTVIMSVNTCVSFCAEQSTIERLVKDKMPKKSGRWWFWRRRDMDNHHIDSQVVHWVMEQKNNIMFI